MIIYLILLDDMFIKTNKRSNYLHNGLNRIEGLNLEKDCLKLLEKIRYVFVV